jgi:hypothetical protein
MSHTPGPWRATQCLADPGTWTIRNTAENRAIARVRARDAEGLDIDTEANARLIAAAPDLLAACKEAERILHAYFASPNTNEGRRATAIMNLIRTAIARAEGR